MFKVKSREQIGKYLSKIIKEKYNKYSNFCREFLRITGQDTEGAPFDNLKNKVSSIVRGYDWIQTEDLPIFSELLGVSCEAILSAGEYSVPKIERLTNYSIAFSKNKKEWEEYIRRDDKLILNQDEFGKNVLDYAFECRNYSFLKYLVENKYIWFVGDNDKDFGYTQNFGAGTSIECRQGNYMNLLEFKLYKETWLRSKMIALAIDNNDFNMLTTLKAREIPSLYATSYLGGHKPDCNKYYDEEMVEHIAKSNNEKIIEYFAEEFEVNALHDKTYTFVFPYINELTELLIKNKSEYIYTVLLKAIEHNKQTFEKLEKLVSEAYEALKQEYSYFEDEALLKERINHNISLYLRFSENGNIIEFAQRFTPLNANQIKGITTNIVYIKGRSDNAATQQLIDKANAIYNRLIDLVKNPTEGRFD